AGHENPTAVLWVVDVRSPSRILHRDVKPPREVQDQLVHVWDYYFTSVQWINTRSMAVIWMARSQNYSVVTQCTSNLWYCQMNIYQRSNLMLSKLEKLNRINRGIAQYAGRTNSPIRLCCQNTGEYIGKLQHQTDSG
ncbi:dipeptidyl aminopeptidase-like protein 6, partial [Trichonephila clavipes]